MTQQDRDDFVTMKIDIKHTKEDVKEIKANSVKLNKDFDSLMFHLVGDKNTGTKGWIQKFETFTPRLNLLEKTVVIISGIASSFIVYAVFVKNVLGWL